jgi:hypothetical protein
MNYHQVHCLHTHKNTCMCIALQLSFKYKHKYINPKTCGYIRAENEKDKWLQQVSIIPLFYILLAKLCNKQECLQMNCIHMQTCIIQVVINCCNLSYFQQKCIHKAEMCIYKQKNASLTCSRNLTISYQANSMVTFSAENRLLVNHLDSHR